MPPNLSAILDQIGTTAERGAYLEAEGRFGPVHSIVEQCQARPQARLDAADADTDEVRAWLSGLPVPPDASVTVLWPFEKQAARLAYGSFVDRYDDLWYPSSDDVVVYWQQVDELGVIVLGHEEDFTFASVAAMKDQ